MGKMGKNKAMTRADAKFCYGVYAQNIDIQHLQCEFNGTVGKPYRVHGDIKSVRSLYQITFHSMTMHTTGGKYKVWVYRGEGEKWIQDTFEIETPTKEEFLRVMLERAIGEDTAGNKVEITN